MIRLVLFALTLTGCTATPVFDSPTFDEQQVERMRCYEGLACRLLIDDRPPDLLVAVNDTQNCAGNASQAVASLAASGHRAEVRHIVIHGESHAYAYTMIDGREWVVDNGHLPWCGKACTLEEALHGR